NLDDHRIPSKRPGHPVTAIPARLNLGGIRNRELAGVTGERDPPDVAVREAGDHRYYRSDLRHEPSSGITARVSVRGAAGPCGDRPRDQDSGERQRGGHDDLAAIGQVSHVTEPRRSGWALHKPVSC